MTKLAEFFERSGAPKQVAFAKELGISEGYLSRLISGQSQPSLPLAVRISNRTGVPIEQLLAEPRTETSA